MDTKVDPETGAYRPKHPESKTPSHRSSASRCLPSGTDVDKAVKVFSVWETHDVYPG